METRYVTMRTVTLLLTILSSACNEQPATQPATTSLESASANPCLQRIASWTALQSAMTATSVADRVAQIQAAALEIGEDPERCTTSLIGDAIDSELRKVVLLKVGVQEYPAVVIYSCGELREGTRCSGREADDTEHLGEALDVAPALPADSDAQVQAVTDYAVASLQWYQALDSALLDDAQAAIALRPKEDGALRVPGTAEANVVFAIGRGPGGEFHKWVWLVK